MNKFKIGEAANLLGVSSDMVRRWVDSGEIDAHRTHGGHRLINGNDLAKFAQKRANDPSGSENSISARNRFTGLVTRVIKDKVMTQIEIQAGPHRIVSLISTEAAEDLELAPGALASAVIKSTNVVIERPQ
jgi:molybdopterin-binding protein